MISILPSYNVTPDQATPQNSLWLSDIDQTGFLGHVPVIYIYKAKHNCNIIGTLRNSLSKILVFYYPVAGRLRLTESGRMEVDCNAKGVTLLEAETKNTLNYYGDFSPSESTEELVPKIDYTQPIEKLPLVQLQLTRFHGGEGFAIGVAPNHVLFDGTSVIQFINAWAKLARGEELEPNEMPVLDRTILKLQHQSSPPHIAVQEWKPVEILEHKKRSEVLLKLTSSQVDRLKKKANDHSLKKGFRPYSRFEVITAHIWRCASKVCEFGEDNQPTLVPFSVNIRNRLIPPLPQNYFGNALTKTMTAKCYLGDIKSNPLSYAAQKIREAIYVITDEYIRSKLTVTLSQKQLDNISAFYNGQGQPMNLPYAGNHIIYITSLINMPVYEADFGWGKPMHYGLARVPQSNRAAILPSSDGDGVIVSMNLHAALMQLFKRFFYEEIYISSL